MSYALADLVIQGTGVRHILQVLVTQPYQIGVDVVPDDLFDGVVGVLDQFPNGRPFTSLQQV